MTAGESCDGQFNATGGRGAVGFCEALTGGGGATPVERVLVVEEEAGTWIGTRGNEASDWLAGSEASR